MTANSENQDIVPGLHDISDLPQACFTEWVIRLDRKINLWPQTRHEELTSYIPQLAQILSHIVRHGHDVLVKLEKTRNRMHIEVVSDFLHDLSNGIAILLHACAATMNALSCIYHRIHRRGHLAPWQVIRYMWPYQPAPGQKLIFPKILDDIKDEIQSEKFGRIKHEFLRDVSEELDHLLLRCIDAEALLVRVREYAREMQDHFEKTGSMLKDVDNHYSDSWDADDEGAGDVS